MPAPNPRRDRVLKYLRHDFPHKATLRVDSDEYDYDQVKEAVYKLKDNDPDLLRVLCYHLYTHLPRVRIAEEVGFDPSTVKRKLNKAVDAIMQRLVHYDFPPTNQYIYNDYDTGERIATTFPVTFNRD